MSNSIRNLAKFEMLFPVLIFSLFWQLGSWGITESSEARYAEISREMLETRNWLFPQYLQIMHFDKPLMTYWITAAGLKIFGINAFGARFFLQLAYLLQIFLVFRITREIFGDKKLAYYAAVIYCGMPLVLISIRNLTTDAYLNTFAMLAVWCYIHYRKYLQIQWLYFFFISLGLAIFTKGPFGLILPLLAIYPIQKILKSTIEKGLVKISRLHLLLGSLLTLIVGGWWFFYLFLKSSEFYHFFIGDQIINRVAHANAMKRNQPFWYYFALLPLFILPMLSLFLCSFGKYLKRQQHGLKWLVIMTILVPLLLFSISSSKLILYILPISPYIAIVTAGYLYNLETDKVKKHFLYVLIFYSLVILALIVALLGLIPQLGHQGDVFQFSLLLLLLIYMVYTCYRVKNYQQKILLLFLIFPVFIIPISTGIMKQAEININGLSPVTNFIKSKHMDNQRIIVWNRAVNAIPFNLQKTVYHVKFEHYSLLRNTRFQPDSSWKKYLIDVNEKGELAYFKKLVVEPSVFITRDKLPENFAWIENSYQHQQAFGKWIVYYK